MKNIIKTRVKYMYNRWKRMRVVAVGGNSNNAGYAGVFYVTAGIGSGTRYTEVGGRLCL